MNIYDILNKITFENHELLIDVTDVSKTLEIVNKHIDPRKVVTANCGWGKAPHCWFVHFRCNDDKWYDILRELKRNDVALLPPYIGY